MTAQPEPELVDVHYALARAIAHARISATAGDWAKVAIALHLTGLQARFDAHQVSFEPTALLEAL